MSTLSVTVFLLIVYFGISLYLVKDIALRAKDLAVCGILLASEIKICRHTLSGVLLFSQNAWDSWGAWGYSFAYNFSQNIPLCLLSGAIVLALPLGSLKYLPCRKKVSRCSNEQRPDQYMP